MKKALKWLLLTLGGVLGLAVIILAANYLYIGHRLSAVHEVPEGTITVPTDEASVAEGARLAKIRGCNGGCHGKVAEGSVFFEIPDGSRVVAPDLGRVAQSYSTAELVHVMRHGVRPDGGSVLGIMPSSMLYNLNDRDLANILAFLKTQSPGEEVLPRTTLGPALRAMLTFFERTENWNILAAEAIDHDAPRPDAYSDDPVERGKYLAMTSCPECHGSDLRGSPATGTPSLAITAAYSLEDFRILMSTGVPIGDRELDLMKDMALNRFVRFTDQEVGDLHAYLTTLVAD